ncbi:hypothetical protein GCM10010915_09010 [Microbacterium faecale]|uniref:Uncharacterized protein n=1 Tax=Microbacterium faecale TaxID=1804630 RepID=A0A916Y533_9MICO|nr:hypothetical protein [Microbacterium faecale]GGD30922.1 hypothetical protein GCM10010915_09010 [Microbacterium faecale]
MTDRRPGRLKRGLVVAISLVAGALAWLVTDSILWLGVGVSFAVMFAVALASSRDDR